MEGKIITHNKVIPYLEKISRDFDVYYPIKIHKDIILTNDKTKISKFHWGIPHIPPKQILIPPKENIYYYQNNKIIIPKHNHQTKILFGIHPADIKAISILDKIFKQKQYPLSYHQKRNNVYIIGMGQELSSSYFQADIFFKSDADSYEIHLLNKSAKFLLKYNNIFVSSKFDQSKTSAYIDSLFSNIKSISLAVEKSHDSKIWDEIAQICLGCGICSYICPLCYCFNHQDSFCMSCKYTAKKQCRWSSCFEQDFFEISSHNFKNKLRDRLYNWYYHKFVRMPREIGHMGCVDCGRCIKYCPAKINFKNVLKSII
jgi:sulfhydrogenase subunit beta (sulfur reductase)